LVFIWSLELGAFASVLIWLLALGITVSLRDLDFGFWNLEFLPYLPRGVNIVQITPGAGGMYCGGCFRDNALVGALRQLGHDTLMLPLYLPLTLDEVDQSAGTPIFFSGVNVYLAQKMPWFRRAPDWLHNALASPKLLRLLGGMAGRTRAEEVGELTVSMLRGEEGNQAREVDVLVGWLKANHRCDVLSLSNVLLAGMARQLKEQLRAPLVCMLQGEDTFLDGLPAPLRATAWAILSERARDIDLFIAPSRYCGELMSRRLSLPSERVRVVHNGINLDGFPDHASRVTHQEPVLGYFARMCQEKGLALAVDVFVELKKRGRVPNLKFHIGGGYGPGDEPFVEEQKGRLQAAGVLADTKFHPNVTRQEKILFLQSLDVFCTPALYGEAFGLYVIEAMAAGVPVVQPRHAAFPEIIEDTGGGVIVEPNAAALATAIEDLLLNPARARALGEAGRTAVLQGFNVQRMAEGVLNVYREAVTRSQPSTVNRQPA
jgi:glycosyltransferase involved in cell wall biosynthesis